MRTRVIPAQITTVEDKIAGNLSLTQIIILLTPVLFSTVIYVVLPPTMTLVWYKLILALFFSLICLLLVIRIKGRIIASWLLILGTYNLRPKYAVYDKNTTIGRTLYPVPTQLSVKPKHAEVVTTERATNNPSIRDVLRLNHLLDASNYNLTYRAGRKGGLNVAFEKVSA